VVDENGKTTTTTNDKARQPTRFGGSVFSSSYPVDIFNDAGVGYTKSRNQTALLTPSNYLFLLPEFRPSPVGCLSLSSTGLLSPFPLPLTAYASPSLSFCCFCSPVASILTLDHPRKTPNLTSCNLTLTASKIRQLNFCLS
jgi:hypothetical protein